MTLHAQALVVTDNPSIYAAHVAERMGLEFETEWSAECGFVKLPDGFCDMHAWPEGLRLDAFAENPESLARVENLVKQQLERTENGRPIVVDWVRRPSA